MKPSTVDGRSTRASRRPGLGELLGGTLRQGFADDVAFHEASGLPGGAFEIALLHYALDGLMLDLLTTSIEAGTDVDDVVRAFVTRLVAAAGGPGREPGAPAPRRRG